MKTENVFKTIVIILLLVFAYNGYTSDSDSVKMFIIIALVVLFIVYIFVNPGKKNSSKD